MSEERQTWSNREKREGGTEICRLLRENWDIYAMNRRQRETRGTLQQ
jgi:hypothetical protein